MPDEQFANQVKSYVEKASSAGVSKIGMGRFIEMKYKEYLMDKEAKREDAYREKMLSLQEREMKLKEQSTESAKKSFQLTQVDTDGDGVVDTFAKFNPYTGEIIREDIDPSLAEASQFDVSTDPAASIEELGQTQPTDFSNVPMVQPGYENQVQGPLTAEAAAYGQEENVANSQPTPQQRLDEISKDIEKKGIVPIVAKNAWDILKTLPGQYAQQEAAKRELFGTGLFGERLSTESGKAALDKYRYDQSGASGSW